MIWWLHGSIIWSIDRSAVHSIVHRYLIISKGYIALWLVNFWFSYNFLWETTEKIRYFILISHIHIMHPSIHASISIEEWKVPPENWLPLIKHLPVLLISHSLRSRHSVVLCMCLSVRLFLWLCVCCPYVFILSLWCVYWSSRVNIVWMKLSTQHLTYGDWENEKGEGEGAETLDSIHIV